MHQYKWVFIMFFDCNLIVFYSWSKKIQKNVALKREIAQEALCTLQYFTVMGDQVRLSWLYEQRCDLLNCTIGKLYTPLPLERRRLSTLGHRHINWAHGSIASAVTSLFEKPEHCSSGSRPHLHSTWTPWCSRTQTALSQKSMLSKSYQFSSEVGGSQGLLKYERFV